jgi:hypothetical protein
MRPEFEKYSAIDDYLSGKLSDQENTSFEKNMAEDPTLREDVFDRKVMNEIIIEKRFFDIASSIRTAPSNTGSLLSNSVKRFIGIGAAITVILFTPYYFSKRSEQAVENTSGSEQQAGKTENPSTSLDKSTATTTAVEQPIMQEEQLQSGESKELVASEELPSTPVEEKVVVTPKEKTAVTKKKKNKSYVLEIPIDDPTAKGHQANSYSFNLKGQGWKIPMKSHSEAVLTIFNKEGDEVYSAAIVKDKNNHWMGISNNGIKQKAGKYAYLLDFGNGDIEHGHVTINP